MKNLFLLLFLLSANLLVAQDIVFRTNVENLRLREQPNLGGKIIKTVPKETVLYWSGERSKEKVMADWNGSKVADYWYQVKFERDSTAWVFGKGIEFIYCQIGTFDDKDMINYTVENEWLDIIK
jgi:Bacterial SH3 domain